MRKTLAATAAVFVCLLAAAPVAVAYPVDPPGGANCVLYRGCWYCGGIVYC